MGLRNYCQSRLFNTNISGRLSICMVRGWIDSIVFPRICRPTFLGFDSLDWLKATDELWFVFVSRQSAFHLTKFSCRYALTLKTVMPEREKHVWILFHAQIVNSFVTNIKRPFHIPKKRWSFKWKILYLQIIMLWTENPVQYANRMTW